LPFLGYLAEFFLSIYYIGFYPEKGKSVLTVYYLMLTLIATSAIGYFAFKANTMQFYLKRKAEAFIIISKEVLGCKEKISEAFVMGILNSWKDTIEGGIDKKIEPLISTLKSYQEEYFYTIKELPPRIEELLKSLYPLRTFCENILYPEYRKNLNSKKEEFEEIIKLFLDDIKTILYDED
jgi:hypothetical protein